jgi:hypothetical protein
VNFLKFVVIAAVLGLAGLAYAGLRPETREPVEFYSGHSHRDGATIAAPEHSGGTDANGCHNGSVPYHCH